MFQNAKCRKNIILRLKILSEFRHSDLGLNNQYIHLIHNFIMSSISEISDLVKHYRLVMFDMYRRQERDHQSLAEAGLLSRRFNTPKPMMPSGREPRRRTKSLGALHHCFVLGYHDKYKCTCACNNCF